MSLIMENIQIESQKKLEELKSELKTAYPSKVKFNRSICVYACGSLGRHEMTQNSDLDLFFITMNSNIKRESLVCSNLDIYNFFANIYAINKKLGYQDPSKQGEYWAFISQNNLLDIGSRQEDFNNSFTARMLLILESKPIYNEKAYNQLILEIIGKYFIDFVDHSGEFYPLYLMNDILRYWYTLTLNYEYRRDSNDDENKKNWKRLKLKYARLVTCFSMLACLYKKNVSPDYVINCIKMTPFERLDMLSDFIDIKEIVRAIKNEYEWFLSLRKEKPEWWEIGSNKADALNHAYKFHDVVVHQLMRVLSESNPDLRNKTDFY